MQDEINPEIFLRDRSTNESSHVREHTVSVFFNVDASVNPVSAWLLSETQTIQPSPTDHRFTTTMPSSFTLSSMPDRNGEGKTRTVHAWIKDESGSVLPKPFSCSVTLGIRPTASIGIRENRDVESSSRDLSLHIVADSMIKDGEITGYMLSETQTTPPSYNDSRFAQNPPQNYTFSDGHGTKRVYLWVKNRYFVNDEPRYIEKIIEPLIVFPEKMRAGHFITEGDLLFFVDSASGDWRIVEGFTFTNKHPRPFHDPNGPPESGYTPGTENGQWHNDYQNPPLEGCVGYWILPGLSQGQIRAVSFIGIPWSD
jgi:hypothetical protein